MYKLAATDNCRFRKPLPFRSTSIQNDKTQKVGELNMAI